MDEVALRQQYTTLLRSTRRNVISPLLKGAAAAFGLVSCCRLPHCHTPFARPRLSVRALPAAAPPPFARPRLSVRPRTQSLGYALWDACSVLAARGLRRAGASLGRLRLLKA